ncbi:MAG: glucose 1-dehydrogenase [Gammaproteobacteria bacterium]|nr:glucose 1-dehydrogenase [Gammaproteobacteria bacterium]
MRLAGKRALVTGAGAGIGRAVAARFAREGARVVVNDLNRDSCESAVASIRTAGGEAHCLVADVRRQADVEQLLERAALCLGGLDILVNNAGIEIVRPITELTEQDWDALMSVNVKGVFFGCKHGIPILERSGGGAVINMASVAGLIGWPLLSAYCASKGAVIQLTKALAQEYKGRSVRFNALCPMLVESDLGQRFIDGYNAYGIPVMDALRARQVRLATVEEVAAAAVFLASDESGFVNGHALVLDNGGSSG